MPTIAEAPAKNISMPNDGKRAVKGWAQSIATKVKTPMNAARLNLREVAVTTDS